MFAGSALIGFGQGFQPVCGFNYGAKLYRRVLQAFWFCVRVALVALICISLAGAFFAPGIVAIFRRNDPDVIRIGARALRLQCLTLPLTSWIITNNMLLQTIGKSLKASVLALARQGLFFLPAIWALPPLIGLWGVQLSQPISDLCTFLLSIPMCISVLRELRLQQEDEDRAADRPIAGVEPEAEGL